jgi:hypothetical protein
MVWIALIWLRDQWRALLNMVMNKEYYLLGYNAM